MRNITPLPGYMKNKTEEDEDINKSIFVDRLPTANFTPAKLIKIVEAIEIDIISRIEIGETVNYIDMVRLLWPTYKKRNTIDYALISLVRKEDLRTKNYRK